MKKLTTKTKVIAVAAIAVAVVAIVSAIVTTSAPAVLRVATTTSLYDTGLWDALEPIFEQRYDVDLQITAQGTGAALALGKSGDVDAVAVHDPAQEAAFVAGNYSVNALNFSAERVTWAYNYFIIVGPESDPAGVGGGNLTPEEAFQKIQRVGKEVREAVKFVSRGDNSGTHGKEQVIWAAAGYNYATDIEETGIDEGWYFETGKGMGDTLVVANEKMAYTLTDKGTFLTNQGDLDLVTLLDTGGSLLNVYSAIICKNGVNPEMAQNMVTFLRAPEVQDLIAGFGVLEYGERLFYPWDPEICGLP